VRRSQAQACHAEYTLPGEPPDPVATLAAAVPKGGQGSRPIDLQWAEMLAQNLDPVSVWRNSSLQIYDKSLLTLPPDIGTVMARLGFRPLSDMGKEPEPSWGQSFIDAQKAARAYIPNLPLSGKPDNRTMAGLSALWQRRGRRAK